MPRFRQASDTLPRAWASFSGDHCYDLAADPEETNYLAGSEAAAAMTLRLAEALAAVEAPAEQYRRLGLSLS